MTCFRLLNPWSAFEPSFRTNQRPFRLPSWNAAVLCCKPGPSCRPSDQAYPRELSI